VRTTTWEVPDEFFNDVSKELTALLNDTMIEVLNDVFSRRIKPEKRGNGITKAMKRNWSRLKADPHELRDRA